MAPRMTVGSLKKELEKFSDDQVVFVDASRTGLDEADDVVLVHVRKFIEGDQYNFDGDYISCNPTSATQVGVYIGGSDVRPR